MELVKKIKLKKGVSTISFIIITVIIIVFSVILIKQTKKSDEDKLSTFKMEFIDYITSIDNDYAQRVSKGSSQVLDSQVYYSLVNGLSSSDGIVAEPVIRVDELGLVLNPISLEGNEIYIIPKDTNILGIKKQKTFYQTGETHYITDKGEAFFLPGYLYNDNGVKKWYINDKKYYESDIPINEAKKIEISEAKITTDIGGQNQAGVNIKKGIKLYLSFDATLDGNILEINPAVPFEISDNGTYSFEIKTGGRIVKNSITVENYRSKNPVDVLKIGDYIDYKPNNQDYTLTKEHSGSANQILITEEKEWRVVNIDKNSGTILITPNGMVNSKIYINRYSWICESM